MNRTDAPKKQPIVFGVNGPRESLPDTTPSGDNTASYNSGFPPITMTLKSAGGLPPKGQDMNQILYELSAIGRWLSAGALNAFDASFSSAIGGYPQGAMLVGNDGTSIYISTINANTNDPNTTATGWLSLAKITAIAALLGGENKLPYFTGVNTAAQTDLTPVGRNIIGKSSIADVLTYLGLGSGLTGVVGAAINARMSVTAPSATATFTADELIVETGTGTQYRLNAFSQAINLGTVGAGGMDTGTAPASGYLAIYALFNPTTGARCLIGVNATAAKVPEIYGGAYMPAGYTASALISVVATNASSLILPFSQIARTITIGSLSVFNTTTASASLVTVNIASAVPKNAKSVKLTGNTSTSVSSALFLNIYETSNAMGQNAFATTSTGLTYTTGYINLPVPQTIYANYGPAVTGFNQALLVSGYTF
ncbi:hypothetical protein KAM546c_20350 [Enterobacter roggenkampii]|uniref:hypothetical protein n=1 Tax=Enterobacter roggenkampii TaxID=1812935 RepID=UPI0021F993B7|nr:hypothetical protein [Enterobacter roggenkampii]BDS20774.1 hypothetical protein KAM546c_20350 [Enterobacter roggenkampii]